jgi:hypothetical protein
VLSSALVSGGWLMEREGAARAPLDANAGARLFDEVWRTYAATTSDTLPDSLLYRKAVSGVLGELHDPHTVFLDQRRLSRLDESTSGHYAGVGIQMDVRDSGITVVGHASRHAGRGSGHGLGRSHRGDRREVGTRAHARRSAEDAARTARQQGARRRGPAPASRRR